MSSILYYSNYCDHSRKILQTLAKANLKDIHYICVDKREKGPNGKTFAVLENGQKVVLPENVTRVPALLLLNQGYQVVFGEAILQHLKPRQETAVQQATFNNMEPSAFAFGGGGAFGSTVVSDQYSFLDQDPDQLAARGDGGMRQMHNYVDLNYVDNFQAPQQDESELKNSGRIGNVSLEQLQSQRDQDLQSIKSRQGPGPFGPPPPQQQQPMRGQQQQQPMMRGAPQQQGQQRQMQYNPNEFQVPGGRR